MAVAVLITESAQEEVDGLPATVQARVAEKIVALSEYPKVSGVKALKGGWKGTYRVKVGGYRILFITDTGTLTITNVDDRKDVYK